MRHVQARVLLRRPERAARLWATMGYGPTAPADIVRWPTFSLHQQGAVAAVRAEYAANIATAQARLDAGLPFADRLAYARRVIVRKANAILFPA